MLRSCEGPPKAGAWDEPADGLASEYDTCLNRLNRGSGSAAVAEPWRRRLRSLAARSRKPWPGAEQCARPLADAWQTSWRNPRPGTGWRSFGARRRPGADPA